MKVYYCYNDYDFERCGHPDEVFTDERDAKKWVDDGKVGHWNNRCYMEFNVEVKL